MGSPQNLCLLNLLDGRGALRLLTGLFAKKQKIYDKCLSGMHLMVFGFWDEALYGSNEQSHASDEDKCTLTLP